MSKLKMTLIGHLPQDGTLRTSKNSAQMFTIALRDTFLLLDYDILCIDVPQCILNPTLNITDVVLIHTYGRNWHQHIRPMLQKQQAQYKISSSFMENMYSTDLPFAYKQNKKLPPEQVIHAPCLLDELPIISKIPYTILVDHGWLRNDQSDRIFSALATLDLKYKIVTLDRLSRSLPPHIQTLPTLGFPEYVQKTSQFEIFIVTHRGSYNSSVIDMIARGIRVIAPVNCVPRDIIDRFKIPEFNTMDQMLKLIRVPYVASEWESKRDLCTDIKDAVRYMDVSFWKRLKEIQEGKKD